MDAGKLFSELVNRQADQSGGILTGTAVSDSVDGSVMVQMDGSVVAQPGEDEVTLTVSADDFVDGAYVLPSVPYAGSLTITDSGGNELEEQDYELDGARLTIFALSSSPIDIAYQTQVQQQITNDDFDGDRYSLASTTNLTVEEMDSEGAWNPATYTLDGSILTIAGIEHQAGIVEFTYIYDVSVVCEPGENVLPDSPDDVAVFGRNSSGVDVVVTDYSLDGDVITLPSTYDAYTVDYPVTTTETWNVSDQYQDEPLEDSDDAADPATVIIGHDLQWPPASVVSCTIDGTAATYALDDVNVVVDAPAVTERWFRLTYDAPVSLQVPASVFATGAFTLPSIPLGSVSTVRAGVVLANTVDDDQLSIASLVVDSPTYSIAYTEQVEQDVVELPCTPYVAEGQFVEIAVVNGMPTVIGASGSGDVTMTLAGDAADAAAAAEDAAAAAQAVADRVSEHFWTDTDGIHVTEVTEEEWNDSTGQSYHSGANVLISSIGQLFRNGLNNLLGFVTSPTTGVAIFDGLGNVASNILASFTGEGTTIGRLGQHVLRMTGANIWMLDPSASPVFHVGSTYYDARTVTDTATVSGLGVGGGPLLYYDLSEKPDYDSGMTLTLTATYEGVYDPQGTVTQTTTISYDGNQYWWDFGNDEGVEITASDIRLWFDFTLGEDDTENWNVTLDITAAYRSKAGEKPNYTLGVGIGDVGDYSSAMGYATEAPGDAAHAEGMRSVASGYCSHAEGLSTRAPGTASHAEGLGTYAGIRGHAEGYESSASGENSHAEGENTVAVGRNSHAQGEWTEADGTDQTVIGRYNMPGTTPALIIGNGTGDSNRSNALTVDWSGNVEAAGDVSAATSTIAGTATSRMHVNKATNIGIATTPSSDTWGNAELRFDDMDGERLGFVNVERMADGRSCIAMTAYADNAGTAVDNNISLYVLPNGTRTYSVSSPTNFRSAIGLGTDIAWTHLAGPAESSLPSGTSERNGVWYRRKHNMVEVQLVSGGTWSNGKTWNTTVQTIATLPSGCRPGIPIHDIGNVPGVNTVGQVIVSTDGTIQIQLNTGSSKYFRAHFMFTV